MGQASSTFVNHAAAKVDIPGQGTLVGSVASDKTTGRLKSQRYAGIPFAQPPVGPLRWKRPQPLPATFRYDTDGKRYQHFAKACPQPTNYALTNGVTIPDAPVFAQSEDCLYLNVWCPVRDDGSRIDRKLPVLFYIHGGWLQIGNARFSPDGDPSDLIHKANLDAIVVTTAYRLNVFGFLTHDELRNEDPERCTGNYGFWDQRAALEWVHRNIEHFGGDPGNITVAGLSAGAHSTHSQLMHEFDLCARDPAYTPIIRRVFLQSNSAIWPSKPVDETRAQFEELAAALQIPAELSDADKITRLREVDGASLARVLGGMDMHTFRATRDSQPGAFVKPDWTRAMMDGRFATWAQKYGVRFVIGECADEEWVYRYINTPTDRASLVRQVHNYYTLPLVHKMLPHYGVAVGGASNEHERRQKDNGHGLASVGQGEASLYTTLGVRPSATSAEIRAAYLAQVRQHHPDKLQQQGGGRAMSQDDAASVAESLAQSDELIRRLNHAYKTLVDDGLRASYDGSLAAARAAASASSQPRISATVDFESFQPVEHGDAITFSYACRCGSAYMLYEDQVHAQVDVVSCDGCSENIRVRYDDDDAQAHYMTPDEVGEVFGRICSDSQVYMAERMLVTDLIHGGLDPERVLRYRIDYRASVIDKALPGFKGVSHSFDDFVWWFACLEPGAEQENVAEWLQPYRAFVHGEDVQAQWYAGRKADARLIRTLHKDGSISVDVDQRWEENEHLIQAMLVIRQELAQSL